MLLFNRKIWILSLSVCLLTGCWELRATENIFYIDAIGIDMKEDNYVVYTQYVNFAQVAKMEEPSPAVVPIHLTKSYGRNLFDAMYHLYNLSPRRTSLEHVKSITISEKALQKLGINPVIEFTGRFFHWRRTMWLFVTNQPLEKVLSTNIALNEDPTMNILSDPISQYKQYSNIKPFRLFQFEAKYYEPGETTYLPIIGLSNAWKEEDKPLIQLKKEGAAFFANRRYIGKIHQHDLKGLKWLDEDLVSSVLVSKKKNQLLAKTVLNSPKIKITPILRNGKIFFELDLKYSGNIFQMFQDVSLEEIEKYAEQELAREIMHTYKVGLKKGIDVYGLSHILYRKHVQAWKKHQKNGYIPLDESSLIIKPDIELQSGGQWKVKKED